MTKWLLAVTVSLSLVFPLTVALADDIVIPGTGDGVAILKALGASFTKKNPDVTVTIPDSIGSSGGIKAAGTGEAVLARVARDIKTKEQGYGLTQTPFARIPAVFFVNRSVSIDLLTGGQVAAIYSGQIKNWKDVGGPDAPIVVVAREETDSTLAVLRECLPHFADLKFASTALVETKSPLMLERVEKTEHAIGFGPYDLASKSNVKVLALDGRSALMADYPCVTTLSFVYKQEALTGANAAFVQFATSSAAALPIRVAGGLPLQ